ncbi:Ribosomal protein Rsm22, bacterial-type [Parasponia andersonii]|uniref:Ribosomal protein Rsm22, bacterial-type n=1 Tax=Parasponia andersonii TaxID=3476 RepID=A0A2P5DJW7_PARAD|nr:Ribosomal protein Rsm22, bacterial-type [Parasponia andersonii]
MATAVVIHEAAQKVFTPETLRSAAKQSVGCLVVPVRLRRAIKKYIRDQEEPHMKRKVLRLSQSLNEIKDVNHQLTAATSKELVEDPLKSVDQSKRWKIQSSYGDIGLMYGDDETIAYVASRMPAVFSACYRVLKEVRRRLPGFCPSTVLDFGAGTGSAFWALREVWPQSLEKVNIVEPSQSMQRAGRSLIQGLSYVLGEIPSLKDRITIIRQLWNLTQDVLVLVEPGTPQGSSIISQMRSHIIWMERRKLRKMKDGKGEASKDLVPQAQKIGAFIVAPCAHDGACPLEKTGTYCHFVQRLERTSTQRAYKRSKGKPIRGFEDEKFSFVAFKRGQRPKEAWPLDGMKFETLKEQHAKRNPEDLEIDYEDLIKQQQEDIIPYEEPDPVSYDSDVMETTDVDEIEEEKGEAARADLGGGWGRIMFSPIRRGKQVTMNICRSTKQDGSEGAYNRVIVTKSKNPTLHHQARKSLWGDLWPF